MVFSKILEVGYLMNLDWICEGLVGGWRCVGRGCTGWDIRVEDSWMNRVGWEN